MRSYNKLLLSSERSLDSMRTRSWCSACWMCRPTSPAGAVTSISVAIQIYCALSADLHNPLLVTSTGRHAPAHQHGVTIMCGSIDVETSLTVVLLLKHDNGSRYLRSAV